MGALARLEKRMQELEGLKQEAIQELLGQRAEIDSQLRELGYKRGRRRGRPKGSKKKKPA